MLLKLIDELHLTFKKEKQSISLRLISCCSSNSVDISLNIFWTVKLNDPIYLRKVHSSRCYICAEQKCRLLFYKVEIYSCSLVLLLSSMKLHDMNTRLQLTEGFINKPHFLARLKENDSFRLLMRFHEAVQCVYFAFDRKTHIVMIDLKRYRLLIELIVRIYIEKAKVFFQILLS